MPVMRRPIIEMDVTGDYVRSYTVHTERSSRRSCPERRRGGAGNVRVSVGREVPGKAGHEEGYVWTERRQDKAAGQMPFRSVSTPRKDKQLGGAPTALRRCTVRSGAKCECESVRP